MSKAIEGFEGTVGEHAITMQEYDRINESVNSPLDLRDENSLKNTVITITSRSESDMAWRTLAACIGPQAVYFFAPSHRSERKDQKEIREELAKSICKVCPVIKLCLDEAISKQEKEGIWGGTTEKERRQMLGIRSRARK